MMLLKIIIKEGLLQPHHSPEDHCSILLVKLSHLHFLNGFLGQALIIYSGIMELSSHFK